MTKKKSLIKSLSKKVKIKKVLKPSKLVVTIKEHKPAEYQPLYFKDEVEKEKKLFFD